MSAMTPDRWARMSWHARERHVAALRREAASLDARLAARRASAAGRRQLGELDAAQTALDATRILATLPTDPKAAQHRADLWHALTRKDYAA